MSWETGWLDQLPDEMNLPLLGYRFAVNFLPGGAIPNPLDMGFQKVEGLSSTVSTQPIRQGGLNTITYQLPTGIAAGNLVLSRGIMLRPSPLRAEFQVTMNAFRFFPGIVLVSMINHTKAPVANWVLRKTYPVRWEISGIDATENAVVVETLELACAQIHQVSL